MVVDFSASWCTPCKTIAPVFKKFAEEKFTDVIFLKVDGDENPVNFPFILFYFIYYLIENKIFHIE